MNYLLTKEEMDAMVPRKDYEDLQNVVVGVEIYEPRIEPK